MWRDTKGMPDAAGFPPLFVGPSSWLHNDLGAVPSQLVPGVLTEVFGSTYRWSPRVSVGKEGLLLSSLPPCRHHSTM